MLVPVAIACPCCGETIEVLIDRSLLSQHYIEDCQVCCRPLMLRVQIGDDGEPQVQAYGEDEA